MYTYRSNLRLVSQRTFSAHILDLCVEFFRHSWEHIHAIRMRTGKSVFFCRMLGYEHSYHVTDTDTCYLAHLQAS